MSSLGRPLPPNISDPHSPCFTLGVRAGPYESSENVSSSEQELFRNEALEHHAAALSRDGQVLRIHPGWIGPAFWLLLLLMSAAAVAAVALRIHQYASGPAFVRVDGRTVLTAVRAGTVVALSAEP